MSTSRAILIGAAAAFLGALLFDWWKSSRAKP